MAARLDVCGLHQLFEVDSMQKLATTIVRQKNIARGFTIVELLIVIVIIAILAALVIVAYSGIQTRANIAKQDADVSQLVKSIMLARDSAEKPLKDITLNTYSLYGCATGGGNPSGIEPKDLPHDFNDMTNTDYSVNHRCWQDYWRAINRIAVASNTNLNSLKRGDSRGNPYPLDENEGESVGSPCNQDRIYIYAGSGVAFRIAERVPNYLPEC